MNGEQERNEEAATQARRTAGCAEVRHLILMADPSALRGGDTALRAHFDGCERCAADAARVLGDIDRLRAALIARGARPASVRPRRSRARVAVTLIPLALAAELAVFAFLSNNTTANPLTTRPIIDDTVTTLLPVAHTEIDTGEVMPPAPRATKEPKLIAAVAAADDSSDSADSLQSAKAPEPGFSESMSQLQVAPASRGQRVTILGTTDPKVHVVLFTKVDSL